MIPALLCTLVLHPPRLDADGVPLPAEAVARVGSAVWRSHDPLSGVAPSADGRHLFAAVSSREIVAWEADTGRLAYRFALPRVNTRAELLRTGGEALAKQVAEFHGEGDRRLHPLADGRLLVLDRHWDNGSVRVVDPLSGRLFGTTPFSIPRLRQARVTRDGRRLAAHTSDEPANHYRPKTQFLHVHDLAANAVAYAVPVTGNVYDFAFSPDEQTLAVADDESFRLLDAATGKLVRTVAAGYWKRVSSFAFRPDGAAFAVWVRTEAAPTHDRLEVWAATGERTLTTEFEVKSGQWRPDTLFRPDGGSLVVKTDQVPWLLIDATTGKQTAALARPGNAAVTAAAFATDGRRLFLAGTGYCNQEGGWSRPAGSFVLPFDLTIAPSTARHAPRPHPHVGTFTHNGDYVAVHVDTLLRRSATTGRVAASPLPIAPVNETRPFAFSPAGDQLATVVPPADKKSWAIDVLDLATGRRTTVDAGPAPPYGLQFTPDGRTLFSHLTAGSAWDLTAGKKVPHPWDREPAPNWHAVLGGRWVTTGDPLPLLASERKPPKPADPLRVYDRENWQGWKSPAWTLRPDGWAAVALVTPDGRRAVVTPRFSGRMELWEGPAGHRRWAGPADASPRAFSPDARTIAATGGEAVVLIETATGGVRHRFVGHRGWPDVAAVGAFSPDGRLLAANSLDAPVYLWDVHGDLHKPADPPDLATAWDDLASADAAVAFQAVRRLAWFPDRAVPLLRAKSPPVSAANAEQTAAWVAALDAPAFADRETALKGLKALGDQAVPDLEAALKATASAEVRVRIEKLLAANAARPWTADEVRTVRAVEAVEWMATPAADALLTAWAAGAAGARLTREATDAVGRRGRSTSPPARP